jgi:hypothetical protein
MAVTSDARLRDKDWTLGREAFDRLLDCLDADRERAGAKYELIRRKLVKFFTWRGSQHPDDHADRTIDRVARRLEDGVELRVADPYLYFHGVALMVLREHWRDSARVTDAIAAQPAPADTSNSLVEDAERLASTHAREARLDCLDTCLRALSQDERELVRRYHLAQDGQHIAARRGLAAERGITLTALRLRVFRIRGGLETCTAKCIQAADTRTAKDHA